VPLDVGAISLSRSSAARCIRVGAFSYKRGNPVERSQLASQDISFPRSTSEPFLGGLGAWSHFAVPLERRLLCPFPPILPGCGVEGLGGLGFGVWGLGFGVWGVWFGV
jgi:hypothetical protein